MLEVWSVSGLPVSWRAAVLEVWSIRTRTGSEERLGRVIRPLEKGCRMITGSPFAGSRRATNRKGREVRKQKVTRDCRQKMSCAWRSVVEMRCAR